MTGAPVLGAFRRFRFTPSVVTTAVPTLPPGCVVAVGVTGVTVGVTGVVVAVGVGADPTRR